MHGRTIGLRSQICHSGVLVRICELSTVECDGPVCVSSSIQCIGPACFNGAGITAVAFESGSALKSLSVGWFSATGIRSLCVPASVDSVPVDSAGYRFFPSSLQWLGFEHGSRLTRIEWNIFRYTNVSFALLPASLEYIHGSLSTDNIRALPVALDPGNRHLTVVDRTLMDRTETTVLHYFGDEPEVELGSAIVELGAFCFPFSPLRSLTFRAPSRVRLIAEYAFGWCMRLCTVAIPPSVEVIATRAFIECKSLQSVVFEPGSRLQRIEQEVFFNALYLDAVDVPASAQIDCYYKVLAKGTNRHGDKYIRVRFQAPEVRY
jgi:hypothetical protein